MQHSTLRGMFAMFLSCDAWPITFQLLLSTAYLASHCEQIGDDYSFLDCRRSTSHIAWIEKSAGYHYVLKRGFYVVIRNKYSEMESREQRHSKIMNGKWIYKCGLIYVI